jgi:hypothetical protein
MKIEELGIRLPSDNRFTAICIDFTFDSIKLYDKYGRLCIVDEPGGFKILRI